MNSLFQFCQKVTSIDLSNFDTSKVTNMRFMFNNCSNLENIILGNINTSSVEDMRGLFQLLPKLTSIDLANFDTSKVTDMKYMFSTCSNLKYLDLSSFNTSNVLETHSMFYSCSSLIYLNLCSFKLNDSINIGDIFWKISSSVKYCTKDTKLKNYISQKYKKETYCDDICFKENIKIDMNKIECIDSCSNNGYEYECNNICYHVCPKAAYIIFCGDNCNSNEKECFYRIPEGYYLDLNDKVYKKCFEKCKYCFGKGNETINNCKECIDGYTLLNEYKYKTNCFKRCNSYYYFDESNIYRCTDNKCPEKYNKLVVYKNKCIDYCKNDDIYKYEYNNTCYQKCPVKTYI